MDTLHSHKALLRAAASAFNKIRNTRFTHDGKDEQTYDLAARIEHRLRVDELIEWAGHLIERRCWVSEKDLADKAQSLWPHFSPEMIATLAAHAGESITELV